MVQSNVAVDTVTVSVDYEYDGLQVALVIGGAQIMYDGEPVTVPSSELERAGDLPLTVLGLSSGKRVVTASAESAFRVVASGAFEGEDPVPDAPDMLQQLADAYAAANRAADDATDSAASADAAAKRANEASGAVSGAVTAANEAAQRADAAAERAEKLSEDIPAYVTASQQAAVAAASAASEAQDSAGSASASASAASGSAGAAAGSAGQAASSAAAAAESAEQVAGKYITSATATTLDPGQQATATVVDKVLQLGIPKGDKGDPGDVSAVQTADGSDLSVSTDEGIVTIDDSALRARIEDLENASRNVVTGTSTDLVAHGEDAYAQKPIETRIKGKTWVNRWPVLRSTYNGITITTSDDGLVTVTGTATGTTHLFAKVSGWCAGKSYTARVSTTPTGCNVYFEVQKPSGNTSITATTSGTTLNVASDATNCVAGVRVAAGTTVNVSFRVMLVDGTEAPDCFTPCASIASVETGNLVTSGKNLFNGLNGSFTGSDAKGVIYTDTSDGGIRVDTSGKTVPSGSVSVCPIAVANGINGINWGTIKNKPLPAGTYTVKINGDTENFGIIANIYPTRGQAGVQTFGGNKVQEFTMDVPDAYYAINVRLVYIGGQVPDTIFTVYPQLELGSTATVYEPPTVTTTPLPEVELRGLPNGTCDELVIKADGTCEVERRTGVIVLDGSDDEIYVTEGSVSENGVIRVYLNFDTGFVASNETGAVSNLYQNVNTWERSGFGIAMDNSGRVYFNDPDCQIAKSLRQKLKETPMTIVGVLREPTTEPQSSVTLPTLPAPTFNQYHDSPVPSDTSTEYVRDINIVLANLEAVQAALLGGE